MKTCTCIAHTCTEPIETAGMCLTCYDVYVWGGDCKPPAQPVAVIPTGASDPGEPVTKAQIDEAFEKAGGDLV